MRKDFFSRLWLHRWPLLISLLTLGLDRIIKFMALECLNYGQTIKILPVFNIILIYNTGAAFSLLSNMSGWQRWFFTGVALIVSGVILHWLAKLKKHQFLSALGLCLILGGALGNLIDRLYYGYVIDLFQLYWKNWFFPVFNVADIAITFGAIILAIEILRGKE